MVSLGLKELNPRFYIAKDFTHALMTQLSWYVQSLKWLWYQNLKQSKINFPSNFKYDGWIFWWNVPLLAKQTFHNEPLQAHNQTGAANSVLIMGLYQLIMTNVSVQSPRHTEEKNDLLMCENRVSYWLTHWCLEFKIYVRVKIISMG